MQQLTGLQKPPAMSNTERQRLFRERHPGYYGRLHRKRKAEVKALAAEKVALRLAAEALVKTPLMLPSPAESSFQPFVFETNARELLPMDGPRGDEPAPIARSLPH